MPTRSSAKRLLLSFVAGVALSCALGCRQQSNASQGRHEEAHNDAYTEVPGAVGFDIGPLPSKDGKKRWQATYKAGGRVAKFGIVLYEEPRAGSALANEIEAGDGEIVSEQGSDAGELLIDLKKALEAKRLPSNVQRASSLPFKFVILGERESQAKDGGFFDKPSGNWTTMKVFIDGDNGEVFLNLNPVIGKGQFSEKDVDYGDYVLAKLATVL